MLRVNSKSVPVVAMLVSIVLAEVNVAVDTPNSPTTQPFPGGLSDMEAVPQLFKVRRGKRSRGPNLAGQLSGF